MQQLYDLISTQNLIGSLNNITNVNAFYNSIEMLIFILFS